MNLRVTNQSNLLKFYYGKTAIDKPILFYLFIYYYFLLLLLFFFVWIEATIWEVLFDTKTVVIWLLEVLKNSFNFICHYFCSFQNEHGTACHLLNDKRTTHLICLQLFCFQIICKLCESHITSSCQITLSLASNLSTH